MEVIPAIDLIDGRCVRLRQGNYAEATVYDGDPLDVALGFVDAGARRIHLVDLDAARGGTGNRATIARLRRALTCTLEVGGGIRDEDSLAAVLDLGIDYAVVGSMLVRDPEAVARWAARDSRGTRMIASIDARDGEVQLHGWQEGSSVQATALAEHVGAMGLAAIEYTNIARDGMLTGPDIAGTLALQQHSTVPVILSGGIAATEDTRQIAVEAGGRLAGFIVGRALYEGSFDLRRAVAIAAEHTPPSTATNAGDSQ